MSKSKSGIFTACQEVPVTDFSEVVEERVTQLVLRSLAEQVASGRDTNDH